VVNHGSGDGKMAAWVRRLKGAWCATAVGLLLTGCVSAPAGRQKKLHVYHIGNSLTRSITLSRLHELMAEGGIDYQFGSQLLGGCTLARHWLTREKGEWTRNWESNMPACDTFEPGEPDSDALPKRFGPYGKALSEFRWDALILQPMGSRRQGELQAIRDFINFALQHGATRRFYLYSTWCARPPLRDEDGKRVGIQSIDYSALWEGSGGDQDELFGCSREARHRLTEKVNAEFAYRLEAPVVMIPAGEVFCELDKRLKAGRIPGLAGLHARDPKRIPGWDPETGARAGANILYADGIHPVERPHLDGNISNYALGLTHFAVLTGRNPVGLSGKAYGLDDEEDAALIGALQQAVWDVVSDHPHSGVR
jgi:hypothetical protein